MRWTSALEVEAAFAGRMTPPVHRAGLSFPARPGDFPRTASESMGKREGACGLRSCNCLATAAMSGGWAVTGRTREKGDHPACSSAARKAGERPASARSGTPGGPAIPGAAPELASSDFDTSKQLGEAVLICSTVACSGGRVGMGASGRVFRRRRAAGGAVEEGRRHAHLTPARPRWGARRPPA
jgi:hypothetical protein